MTSKFRILKEQVCFGGVVRFCEHDSEETGTKMNVSFFLPPGEIRGCIIWLSGLTCNEENFMAKAGAQKVLAECGMMVVCPDTSPRGLTLPGEHDHWDFGAGAGFYVDANTAGYRDHYRMYSYVAKELHDLISSEFPIKNKISIMGHSMGGHGALVIGLREPKKFRSISAFAPIVNPSECPWGKKAFLGYFGEDKDRWKNYDACELLLAGHHHLRPILIDQGTNDPFLAVQLLTENIVKATKLTKQAIDIQFRDGYDHSYYYISTFIDQHVRFHAENMVGN